MVLSYRNSQISPSKQESSRISIISDNDAPRPAASCSSSATDRPHSRYSSSLILRILYVPILRTIFVRNELMPELRATGIKIDATTNTKTTLCGHSPKIEYRKGHRLAPTHEIVRPINVIRPVVVVHPSHLVAGSHNQHPLSSSMTVHHAVSYGP